METLLHRQSFGGLRAGHAGLEAPAGAGGRPLAGRFTKGLGRASELAVEAAQEGYPLVVAVGGDGTANETVNGLMQLPPHRRPAFGQLPAGTGNDFARNVGLPGRWTSGPGCSGNPTSAPWIWAR